MIQKIIISIAVLCGSIVLVWKHLGDIRVPDDRFVVLDVGQGDAVLAQSKDGTTVLTDCGPDEKTAFAVGRYVPFGHQIDLLIITHPDSDHVMGCVDIVRQFDVAAVMTLAPVDDLPAYMVLLDEAQKQHSTLVTPLAGDRMVLPGMQIEVLWPDSPDAWQQYSSNDASYVTRIEIGAISMMLTGDASKDIEEKITQRYASELLAATYLKLGHHGSHTSSAVGFIEAVDPRVAVVSAGKENRFGHPHAEVIDMISTLGILLRSTMDGDIVLSN